MFIIRSENVNKTLELGEILGRTLSGGETLALTGNLGSGKTAFVKGLAKGLDITDVITSPTFVVVKTYQGRLTLHHIDFYRLGGKGDLESVGFEDYQDNSAVVAIEWAEKYLSELRRDYLHVKFEYAGEDAREIALDFGVLSEWESRLKKILG